MSDITFLALSIVVLGVVALVFGLIVFFSGGTFRGKFKGPGSAADIEFKNGRDVEK